MFYIHSKDTAKIWYACLLHSVQIICDKVTGAHEIVHTSKFFRQNPAEHIAHFEMCTIHSTHTVSQHIEAMDAHGHPTDTANTYIFDSLTLKLNLKRNARGKDDREQHQQK